MDILGIKYLCKSAFRYLRGSTRNAEVISESLDIMRKNMQPSEDTAHYPVTSETLRNARVAFWTYLCTFLLLLSGSFFCLKTGAKFPAAVNLIWACIFGYLAVRAESNSGEIAADLARRKG